MTKEARLKVFGAGAGAGAGKEYDVQWYVVNHEVLLTTAKEVGARITPAELPRCSGYSIKKSQPLLFNAMVAAIKKLPK